LRAAITSSNWKPQSAQQNVDASFGFEIFNGNCHYGVIFIQNGHLGLLRSTPNAQNMCSGDPANQAFIPISNWEAVRARGTIFVTLIWAPNRVTLHISDGGTNRGMASYTGDAEPQIPLRIRLNADFGETYSIDYVRSTVVGNSNDVVIDFGPGVGIWVWQNNSTWRQLHPASGQNMVTGDLDNNGQAEVIIDFGPGAGIWVWQNNSTWRQLHTLSAMQMVVWNVDGN
jgi:hypothetical protein